MYVVRFTIRNQDRNTFILWIKVYSESKIVSTPNSAHSAFDIGNVSFYHYQAQDAHGTCVFYFAVDGRRVSDQEYRQALADAMRKAPWYKEVSKLCVDMYLGIAGIKPADGEHTHHIAAKKDK